jgi:glucokinase
MTMEALGIDLGGTRIKLGSVAHGAVVDELVVESTAASRGVEEILDQLVALAEVRLDARPASRVGLAIPGLVDVESGRLLTSPNFPQWKDVHVAALLSERLGIPVHIINDASAATLGEARSGAAAGIDNVAGFTLGTGVGGGLILNGDLHLGASGMAAEFGHLLVNPGGRPCGCGGRGCLEQSLGVDAIRSILRESATVWASRADEREIVRDLCASARAGDRWTRDLIERAGRDLGYAIASVALVVDIERVVLMGGVARAHDLLIPTAIKGLRERIYDEIAERISIVPGTLGDRAGVVGAAWWAHEAGS